MPSNVVDTEEDEEKWKKAKEKAKEQGHEEDYAYIMSIYKNMCPDGIEDKDLPDHCSNKSSSKTTIKKDLIKLGQTVPSLRKHISHVIERLEKIPNL